MQSAPLARNDNHHDHMHIVKEKDIRHTIGFILSPEIKTEDENNMQSVSLAINTPSTTSVSLTFIRLCNYNAEDVRSIITQHPSLLEQQDERGYTLLARAVEYEKFDLVKCLVELGADVHAKTKSDGHIFYLAALNGRTDVLYGGVDVLDDSIEGNKNAEKIVSYLMTHGCNTANDIRGEGMFNPLFNPVLYSKAGH